MNNHTELKINKKEIVFVLIVYVIAALYFLYFSPFCGRTISHRLVQLIPFKTLLSQLRMPYGIDSSLGNIAGNLLLLAPLGFGIALLGRFDKKIKRILIFIFIAFSIELLQYIFKVGCLDIDDIWMNALGGIIGWRLGFRIKK